jgi:DNA adenine methylase
VKEIFKRNDLCDGVYAEPYAGGASVALTLLFERLASKILINDLDPAVYAFWTSAINDTDGLCRLVRDVRPTVAEWERQRSIYSQGVACPPLLLGFAAFFLNRTNRSGIIASAGLIGGRKQNGEWKMDARYNRLELAERIERIGKCGAKIEVSNEDAAKFLERIGKSLPLKSLVYLDPPYFVKGERRLYANYYDASDHAAIARAIARLKRHWIVSYDQAPEIRALYAKYRSLRYSLRYSASTTRAGDEVMFFSNALSIPKERRPLHSRLSRPKIPLKAA